MLRPLHSWIVALAVFGLMAQVAEAQASNECFDLIRALAGPARAEAQAASLSRAELERATKERTCLMSFMWPQGFDPQKDVDSLTSARMKQIRDRVYQLEPLYQRKYARLSPRKALDEMSKPGTDFQEKKYVYWRLEGVEPEQVRLFGDFFLGRTLVQERKFDELFDLTSSLRKQGRIKPAPHQLDAADESTYFSIQTLHNLLAGLDHIARAHTATDSETAVKNVVDYLNERSSFVSVEAFLGDLDSAVLNTIDAPEIARVTSSYEHEFPAIAGFGLERGVYTFFFRGGADRLHTVRVGDWRGAQVIQARDAYTWLRSYTKSQIAERSTNAMRLFNVTSEAGGAVVDVPGDSFTISQVDLRRLNQGQRLDEEHPFTKWVRSDGDAAKVLYSNPLMYQAGPERTFADEFVFAAQRAYGESRIYRDPLSERTAKVVESLNRYSLASADDLFVVTSEQSFAHVEDWNIINNLLAESEFAELGASVIHFDGASGSQWDKGRGKTVIVITGHSDEELRRYVRALGDAGYLEDNVILFNSCGTPLSQRLAGEMSQRYRAAGVFSYQGKIDPGAVEDVLNGAASELLRSFKNAGTERFVDLIRRAVGKTKLRGVWTVCYATEIRISGLANA